MFGVFMAGVVLAIISRNSPLVNFVPHVMLGTAIGVAVLMATRRLNDMDRSGWLSLLGLVPLVNLVFAMWILCTPGSLGSNKYGPPASKNNAGVWVAFAGAVIAASAILGLFGSMTYTAFKLDRDARAKPALPSARQAPR